MTSGVSPTSNVLLYFLAIILPPIAVLLDRGFGVDFIINICLTILAWIPGIIHAWYLISVKERLTGAADPAAPVAPVGGTAPLRTTAPATTTAPGTAAGTY